MARDDIRCQRTRGAVDPLPCRARYERLSWVTRLSLTAQNHGPGPRSSSARSISVQRRRRERGRPKSRGHACRRSRTLSARVREASLALRASCGCACPARSRRAAAPRSPASIRCRARRALRRGSAGVLCEPHLAGRWPAPCRAPRRSHRRRIAAQLGRPARRSTPRLPRACSG
jgi:hypothetical protein